MGDNSIESQRLARAKEIFLAARALSLAQREDLIARECADDAALIALVRELLAGEEMPLPFESIADDIRAAHDARPGGGSVGSGDRIGNYHLLERIGEGGFGVVFMAEQEKPVRRKVALKIIKLGMDTKQVVARFEAERQALAMMEHPSIARVFDAGATETGRPYFVMELVKGMPITEYCDQHKLPIRERLTLISQVCEALQHAHQRGVIHRDIKPSNVLVADSGGVGMPKIIDFGIAKATSARLTEKTIFTEFRHMIGTPEYMSPEQAGESGDDVDTRTDVYAVGVLLYELLTGATPFDSKRLRSAAYGEMQRIIREEDPPAPSTRVASASESLATVAQHRSTPPTRLSGTIRGELDWIVMKAMEKDRSRRYDSAGSMAADIQRYLSGHAVLAAPPDRVYLARKFVARHRGAVVAGSLVAATLIVGLAGTSWGFYNADARRREMVREKLRADEQAEQAIKESARADAAATQARAAEAEAHKRARDLEEVARFQTMMLAQIDPAETGRQLLHDLASQFEASLEKQNPKLTEAETESRRNRFVADLSKVNATETAIELINRAILKPSVSTLDTQFQNQPLVDARLRHGLGGLYADLGLFDVAGPLLRRAAETFEKELGPEHADTLDCKVSNYDLLREQGRFAEAEALSKQAVQTARRALGNDHPVTLTAVSQLGMLFTAQGKLEEAEPLLREALDSRRRTLGPDHIDTLSSIASMGSLLLAEGKRDEAEALRRQVWEALRDKRGEDDPLTLIALNNLGNMLSSSGKLSEAEPLCRMAAEKRRRVLGEEHPFTLSSLNNYALLLQRQGKYTEAEPLLRDTLATMRRVLGDFHPYTSNVMNGLGTVLQDQRRFDEAEPLLREAVEKKRLSQGDRNPTTLLVIGNYARLLRDLERHAEAETLFREVLAVQRSQLKAGHPELLFTLTDLASVLRPQGQAHEALDLLSPLENVAPKSFGSDARRLAWFEYNLGVLRGATGDFEAGEKCLLHCLANFQQYRGPTADGKRPPIKALVDLYIAWNTADAGKGHDSQAREWKERLDALPLSRPGK